MKMRRKKKGELERKVEWLFIHFVGLLLELAGRFHGEKNNSPTKFFISFSGNMNAQVITITRPIIRLIIHNPTQFIIKQSSK